eukprot:2313909-Rhodomonas_salina.4
MSGTLVALSSTGESCHHRTVLCCVFPTPSPVLPSSNSTVLRIAYALCRTDGPYGTTRSFEDWMRLQRRISLRSSARSRYLEPRNQIQKCGISPRNRLLQGDQPPK